MKFCNRPFKSIHILPGGRVWPCGWMHFDIGDLSQNDLHDIWHSEAAEKMRESILDGSYRYCRKESCPFLENDSLPDLSEEELKKAAIPTDLPVNISAACDFTCNHMCPSCRQEIFHQTEEYKNKLDTIIKRISPAVDNGESLITDGNGEVFASPQILGMLENVKPKNPNFHVSLETNGALFDEPHWNKIAHLGDYYVKVTVTPNSFEKDTFKYLSGCDDNVEKLCSNLNFIKKLRHEGKINYFAVSIVVQDRNYRELPSFTKRCLDEFDVDEVTVKPVYQWFGMKEETYWFKNIRNPLHPYHKEYMELLKDPVFDDKRVFFWGSRYEETAPKVHPAYKHKVNEEILLRIVNTDDAATKVAKILKNLGAKNIAVFTPEDEVAVMTAKLLKKGGINPSCFLQRFPPKKEEANGLKIYGFPDMDFTAVDTIIITDNYNYEKVCSDIKNHNFRGRLLSLEELSKMIGGAN